MKRVLSDAEFCTRRLRDAVTVALRKAEADPPHHPDIYLRVIDLVRELKAPAAHTVLAALEALAERLEKVENTLNSVMVGMNNTGGRVRSVMSPNRLGDGR